MRYNAPFTLNSTIVLNLTAAEANGNLGNLADGSGAAVNALTATGKSASFILTLPAAAAITDFNFFEHGGGAIHDQLSILYIPGQTFTEANLRPRYGVEATASPSDGGGRGNINGVYDNGVDGVGATITVDIGDLPLMTDNSYFPVNGDKVLVAGQTSQSENGVYRYDDTAFILTRDTLWDNNTDVTKGSYMWTDSWQGSAARTAIQISPSPITIGTDPISFMMVDFQYNLQQTATGMNINGATSDTSGTVFSPPIGLIDTPSGNQGFGSFSRTDASDLIFCPTANSANPSPRFQTVTLDAKLFYNQY